MKQIIFTAFICLAGIVAKAQSTEIREAKTATKLEVKNGIEVIITQSDTTAVKVEAASNAVLQKVVTKYSGSTLKVWLTNSEPDAPIGAVKVYVSQKSFPAIKAEGGASVKAVGKWYLTEANIDLATGATFSGELDVTGAFTIKAASGSGFRGIVHAGVLKCSITGGAYAKVMGNAKLADVYCSSGSLQAGKLVCLKAEIMAQNASSICIQAKEFIKAETDPSSSITYYGEPEHTQLGHNSYTVKRNTNKLSLN